MVLLKEVEKLHKRCVGDVNAFAVKGFKLVFLEDAAVEVWDFTEQPFHLSASLIFRFRESFKEEWTEEFFVVSVSAVCLTLCQFGRQIIWVTIKENFSFG